MNVFRNLVITVSFVDKKNSVQGDESIVVDRSGEISIQEPNIQPDTSNITKSNTSGRYYWFISYKCQRAYAIMNCPSCVVIIDTVCGQSSWPQV